MAASLYFEPVLPCAALRKDASQMPVAGQYVKYALQKERRLGSGLLHLQKERQGGRAAVHAAQEVISMIGGLANCNQQ